MDFNGLQNFDFDFFRKKDKMQHEEYENGRNEVKTHFRSLCYEMQKIHHKRTGGVLIIDNDFQNFNKRSNYIYADHIVDNSIFKITILMNCDNLRIEGYLLADGEEKQMELDNFLATKKREIFDFMMVSKFTCLHAELSGKDEKDSVRKLTTIDLNEKNFEEFVGFIKSITGKGKRSIRLGIGFTYTKNECTKHGKGFADIAYDSMNSLISYVENFK